MAERDEINVGAPPGGWGAPWPLAAEIESVVPHEHWTLVGGLMAQLYSIDRGIAVVRPTDDVDMVVHIETQRGVPNAASSPSDLCSSRRLTTVPAMTTGSRGWRHPRG